MQTSIDDRRRHPRTGWWPGCWPGIFLSRLWWIVSYGDTRPTRVSLALCSAAWAFMLWLPGDTFTRPVYRLMAQFATENVWAALWATHAILLLWRTFSCTKRLYLGLAVNVLGVALFCGAAGAIFATLTYPVPAGISPDMTLALAAIWVFIRTGVQGEAGWKRD